MPKKNLILTGMMGSGKSTVGLILLSKLQNSFNFIDTDELIVKIEGESINEIFKSKGESYFRALESRVVDELVNTTDKIIATGGGIVKNQDNIKKLKKNGIVFYLSAPLEEIFSRLKNASNRPLLNSVDMKNTIDMLLKERQNLYKQADYEVDTVNKSPEEVADEIIEIYNKL